PAPCPLPSAAGFADTFEARGTPHARRGDTLGPVTAGDQVVLGYRGLDGVTRRTRLAFQPAPAELSATSATFHLDLPPQGEATVFLTIACERDDGPNGAARAGYDAALAAAEDRLHAASASACSLYTAN